ncbi:hypothetical protein M758_UG108600 [Ceratodon purpureus]|nr:hypothetical protein M758_UG108600 [Ceratodon purpureus]
MCWIQGTGRKCSLAVLLHLLETTTGGLQNKEKKMVDGSSNTTPDLHLDTSDLMELEFECVAAEDLMFRIYGL